MAASRTRRSFGGIRKLPSGRLQAYYTGPDQVRHAAPQTFTAKIDAEAWLVAERRLISEDRWRSPADRARVARRAPTTFGAYAERWLEQRTLKPRTRGHYRTLLDSFLLPTFRDEPIAAVTPAQVNAWHHDLEKRTGPTYRAHAYSLLRTIYRAAVADDEVAASPCRIVGAGSSRRVVKIEPATLDQLATATAAMPERLRAAVLLSSWCGLRYGETFELRRSDLDLRAGVLHVRRAVTWPGGAPVVGPPKSAAGSRDVAIPPHLLPLLREHLAEHAAWGRTGLLFPSKAGAHVATATLARHWTKAREAADRPDLRWHDLRHTGAVLAAAAGGSLAELMARLGHSTPGAALRYQHAAQGRDAEIAAKLSEMAKGSA